MLFGHRVDPWLFMRRLSPLSRRACRQSTGVRRVGRQSGHRFCGKVRGLEIPFALLLDSDGQLKRSARIGILSILIVDRWGVVQLRHEAREAHDFLAPSEIEDWLRYLAIQCPECQGEVF
jgi:hypothetical protein